MWMRSSKRADRGTGGRYFLASSSSVKNTGLHVVHGYSSLHQGTHEPCTLSVLVYSSRAHPQWTEDQMPPGFRMAKGLLLPFKGHPAA